MLLSICIPVKNNLELLRVGLTLIAESIFGYEDKVEVIVGDNASTDRLEHLINEVKSKYTNIELSYYRNSHDLGLALNFIKVVNQARGKFVWLIGSDDFVYPNSVGTIIEIIEKNVCDFIGLNHSSVKIKRMNLKKVNSSETFFKYNNFLISDNVPPIYSDSVSNVNQLVDPFFNSVMLGAVMVSVFNRKIWNQADFNGYELSKEFVNLESIYPHVIVFATQFISKRALYIKEPLVIAGSGARSWNEDRKSGQLLHIYFNIFPDIVELYEKNELDSRIVIKCKRYVSYLAGKNFFSVFFEKIFKKNKNPYILKINLLKTLKVNLFYPSFYKALASSLYANLKLIIKKNLLFGKE